MPYALGKLPARPDAVKLKFPDFFNKKVLPKPPLRIGHELIGHEWGALGNHTVGDCLFAGFAHEHMVWTHMGTGSTGVEFTDKGVISDYSALTGYDGTPATDKGSDMSAGAAYRRKTGVIDAKGDRANDY